MFWTLWHTEHLTNLTGVPDEFRQFIVKWYFHLEVQGKVKANNMCNSQTYFTELQQINASLQCWLHVKFFTCHWARERQAKCASDASTNLKFSYGIKIVLSM